MKKQYHSPYFKNLIDQYPVWRILQYVILSVILLGYLDIYNIPTGIILKGRFSIVVTMLIVAFVMVWFLEKHILEIFKIRIINVYDMALCVLSLLSLVYAAFAAKMHILNEYKLILSIIIFCMAFVLLVVREAEYNERFYESELYVPNTYDLKELYDGNIYQIEKGVYFDEKEVEYDLLNRESTINHLYNAICNCKPQGSFVISLEGKWGSGKTTILRNVKRLVNNHQEDLVIIDDFDPWTYGSEKSLIEAIFSSLLHAHNLKINIPEIQKSMSVIQKAIAKIDVKKSILADILWKDASVNESKRCINEYLSLSDKKIVFFIDNLDRADNDKIVFLFKLIGNVLNFNKIIYVLSFDPERIKKILEQENQIDYTYLEKIIQMPIHVPAIDRNVLADIIEQCTKNLLMLTEVPHQEYSLYDEFSRVLSENIADLRSFKRIINSIILKTIESNTLLFKRDLLILEFIKFSDFEVYNHIRQNYKYFVSHGKMFDKELLYSSINKDAFEIEKNNYFDSFFSNQHVKKYKKLLAYLFPNIKNYMDRREQIDVNTLADKDIEKYRSVASVKYFHLYFTDTNNQFAITGGMADKVVRMFNEQVADAELEFSIILSRLEKGYHVEFMEAIERKVSELTEEAASRLFFALKQCYWDLEDYLVFFRFSGRRRATHIMWELLQKVSDNDFAKIKDSFKRDFANIGLANNIYGWAEDENHSMNDLERLRQWKTMMQETADFIISKGINLYNNRYYRWRNIWGVYHNAVSEEVFQQYIRKIVSEKNVFRMMYDMVTQSVGNQYGYHLESKNIAHFLQEDELETLLEKTRAISADEEFLLHLYEIYKEAKKQNLNEMEGRIYCQEERILKL